MKSPIRVAMLTGEYPPDQGGVADYTASLANELARLGLEVRLLLSETSHHAPPGIEVATVPTWKVAGWPRILAAARDCHVLHIQYQPAAYGLSAALNLLPWWLRIRIPRLRVVTTFHDLRVPYVFPGAGPLRKLAVIALLHGSHASIFTETTDLLQVGRALNHHWIPLSGALPVSPQSDLEREALRRRLGVESGEVLIGHFGFLNASKGLDILLEALARLVKQGENVRLILVGGVGKSDPTNALYAQQMDELVDRLGLRDRVISTGYRPHTEASAYLLACDLAAQPYNDGASLRRSSLLAVLAHSLPVVTTQPPVTTASLDTAPQLGHEVDALLVSPEDPGELAEALLRLTRDQALRARLGSAAQTYAARFSWSEIARSTLRVYEKTLAGRS